MYLVYYFTKSCAVNIIVNFFQDQFDQKDLEGLYRKYYDKLRETLVYIYITLLVTFSTIHIVLVIIGTYSEVSVYIHFRMIETIIYSMAIHMSTQGLTF